ncbi:hypothetical protein B9W73_03590 [Lactococcus lactis]|uniref:hypothetical protein n=1 Tax=Lactococcus lactis TaxID=1358 RepID=UPI000A1EBE0A|nr:hypothetical protein [Lactococcus lactis]OSP87367.1 hypothetical protein B9W73_03590 [Lactococcus lactis]
MTETAKEYTLTAQDIQVYLCELGIKPTEEVSIYSIEYYFDKQTVTTDKLSVEKLEPIGYYNGAYGFLYDEFDKDCYCQGGCSMEAVYAESQVKKLTGENKVEKLQEQLNSKAKALTEICEFDCSDDCYFTARDALAAIEKGENNEI